LALADAAVATSGDRWHRFEQDGTWYTHTFDPRLGAPVPGAAAAVTVVAAEAMHADAWATALTVMGPDERLAFARARDLAARFVARDGTRPREALPPACAAHLAPRAAAHPHVPAPGRRPATSRWRRCCCWRPSPCCHCTAGTGGRPRRGPRAAGWRRRWPSPIWPSPCPSCGGAGPLQPRHCRPEARRRCWWPGPARPALPAAWPNAARRRCAPAAARCWCCRWKREIRNAWPPPARRSSRPAPD